MPVAYVQDVFPDDNSQNLLFKIGRILAASVRGLAKLSVRVSEFQSNEPPTNASVSTTSGTVFTLAAGEKGYVQNLDTDALFVRRAAGASSSAFHYVLSACGTADDGTGGAIAIEDHLGVVSVSGTTPRFIAWSVLG